jgi:hypothetical protein
VHPKLQACYQLLQALPKKLAQRLPGFLVAQANEAHLKLVQLGYFCQAVDQHLMPQPV